jgi:hypothetical protein
MQADKFNITGSWQPTAGGHVYEAIARTANDATRVIAVARGQMSLDVAHDLEHYVGAAGKEAVEQSVREACRQMALASPG